MFKKANKETLADKIAGVLNVTPNSFDPEDDHIDDTRAKVIESFSEQNEDDELLSTFRKKNIELLADVDERYAGKNSNRRSLHDSDEDISEQESIESEIDEKESVDEENNESNEDELNEKDENLQSDESNEDGSDENFDEKSVSVNEGNFKHFTETDVSAQVKKGLCVKNQMNMWESLLEIRIQLQKCLIAANKMPQKNTYFEIKNQSGQEFTDKVTVTKNSLINLLDKLLLLQRISLNKYPETKKLSKSNTSLGDKKDEDEEISSDTENEKSVDEHEDENEKSGSPRKKRKLNDFEKDINDMHNLYNAYRDTVIQKWNDKTIIASVKHNSNSHSVLNHIEHTLSDRSKLIKRTRFKRSEYNILGQEPFVINEQNVDNKIDNRIVEEYNTEIFDDDDFYHQLLRELIEVKSADLTDPIQLSRQWIQLQKLRSKMKRKIDTRATKGRKIRYTVHTKLVNFMAPIDEHLWTEQAKTELFNSLFGKKEYCGTS